MGNNNEDMPYGDVPSRIFAFVLAVIFIGAAAALMLRL